MNSVCEKEKINEKIDKREQSRKVFVFVARKKGYFAYIKIVAESKRYEEQRK